MADYHPFAFPTEEELLAKDREKRLLLQREFHAERTAMDEIRRKARMKAEG